MPAYNFSHISNPLNPNKSPVSAQDAVFHFTLGRVPERVLLSLPPLEGRKRRVHDLVLVGGHHGQVTELGHAFRAVLQNPQASHVAEVLVRYEIKLLLQLVETEKVHGRHETCRSRST